MQGHKSSITNSSLDHGSTSSEPILDSQISWNHMQDSPRNQLPAHIILPNEANIQYLPPLGNQRLSEEWSLRETSSTGERAEREQEHTWSIGSRPVQSFDELPFETPNMADNIDLNVNSTPRDLDSEAELEEPEREISRIIGNYSNLPAGINNRRKRKSLDMDAGGCSDSEAGASRLVENGLPSNPGLRLGASGTHLPEPFFENGQAGNNPALRLGAGGTHLPEPLFALARSEGSQRSCRLRINGPSNPVRVGLESSDLSPSRALPSASLCDHLLGLNPAGVTENSSLLDQPGRWAGPSGPRMGPSAGVRDPLLRESRSISEHPIFVPSSGIGSLLPPPRNWNSVGVGPIFRAGSGSGVPNSSGPLSANRGRSQASRRLSDIFRRPLLMSAGVESSAGGQSSSRAVRPGPSRGAAISTGPNNQSQHFSGLGPGLHERRHIGTAYVQPYTLRTSAAGPEGRTGLMSEQIRRVFDLMRRGEGLRFEDVMMLDRSLFFGTADIRDPHRDMRLDIDNMSYEELLALGDRIGTVSTGLNEEAIIIGLKQTTYVNRYEDSAETDPCCICREEYIDGEDVGSLDCGHEFHVACIKQWLVHKNLCPVCKTTGLAK